MKRFIQLYNSHIGKKFIAAVTGAILFLFLLGHVAGNLKVFTPDQANGIPAIDVYAHFLRTAGHPMVPEQFVLWGSRIGLLVALILHMVVVMQLAALNRRARPQKYAKNGLRAVSWSARWMLFSGFTILAFVVFHILHFTTGTIEVGEFEHGFVYANLYHSFACWPIAVLYVVAICVVGFHLYHGLWSLFQTIGFDNPDRNAMLRTFALAVTIALVIGFSSLPLAFMSGAMEEPPEYSQQLLIGEEQ